MCRYSMLSYKPHYACFHCRKTFKRRLLHDVNRDSKIHSEAKCPQCGELMANMGLDFSSPKKDNIKEWDHTKKLYSVGITFHSCGCTGPGYIPNSTERLREYLEETKANYFKNLEFWRNRIEPITKQAIEREKSKNFQELYKIPNYSSKKTIKNQEGIDYWIERIKQVEAKLAII